MEDKRVCDYCGKEFYLRTTPGNYLYKKFRQKKIRYYCSYGCCNKSDIRETLRREESYSRKETTSSGRVVQFKSETGLNLKEGAEPSSWIVVSRHSYLQVSSLIRKYNSEHSTRICCLQGTGHVVIYMK